MAKKDKKKKKEQALQGSQRPLAMYGTASIRRRYDLEIEENPIRDPAKAREYIEVLQYCYEARHTLSIAADDCYASSDGDDRGFSLSDTLNDNTTPINPRVKEIAEDLISRKQDHENYVIGSDRFKKALRWALGYGDCFVEMAIEREGISASPEKDYGISRTLYLPTWEMFRKENDQGYLEQFEQRKYLSHSDPDYTFNPAKIIHFRHEPKFLYGESIFAQSLRHWGKLKEAGENLADAARDLGINPNVHEFGENMTEAQVQLYKRDIEQKRLTGIITDYYLMPGMKLTKMANQNPTLTPLIENLLQWRYHMIPPGFPTFFYPGLMSEAGTKDLSKEPAKRYARMRYGWCQLVTKGIKQAIDTEIILREGYDWWRTNALNKYRIIWPAWIIDGMEGEMNRPGTDDLEPDNPSTPATPATPASNGNGRSYLLGEFRG